PRDGQIVARSEALWCELVCEVLDEHWAVNAEAFGVRLDDPTDAWHGELGHRIPVGLELDWEAFAPPCTGFGDITRAEPGRGRGEILLRDHAIDSGGWGLRDERVATTNRTKPSGGANADDLSEWYSAQLLATAIVDERFGLYFSAPNFPRCTWLGGAER